MSINNQAHLSTDNNGNVYISGTCEPGNDNSFSIGGSNISISPQPITGDEGGQQILKFVKQ